MGNITKALGIAAIIGASFLPLKSKGQTVEISIPIEIMIQTHPLTKDTAMGDKHIYNLSLTTKSNQTILYSLKINKEGSVDELTYDLPGSSGGYPYNYTMKDKNLDGILNSISIDGYSITKLSLKSNDEIENRPKREKDAFYNTRNNMIYILADSYINSTK